MPCPDANCGCQFTPDLFAFAHNSSGPGICVCGHKSFLHTEKLNINPPPGPGIPTQAQSPFPAKPLYLGQYVYFDAHNVLGQSKSTTVLSCNIMNEEEHRLLRRIDNEWSNSGSISADYSLLKGLISSKANLSSSGTHKTSQEDINITKSSTEVKASSTIESVVDNAKYFGFIHIASKFQFNDCTYSIVTDSRLLGRDEIGLKALMKRYLISYASSADFRVLAAQIMDADAEGQALLASIDANGDFSVESQTININRELFPPAKLTVNAYAVTGRWDYGAVGSSHNYVYTTSDASPSNKWNPYLINAVFAGVAFMTQSKPFAHSIEVFFGKSQSSPYGIISTSRAEVSHMEYWSLGHISSRLFAGSVPIYCYEMAPTGRGAPSPGGSFRWYIANENPRIGSFSITSKLIVPMNGGKYECVVYRSDIVGYCHEIA